MNERRSRKPTLHDRLDHLFELSWKRDERINRKLEKIMTSNENLAAAVARVEGVGPSVIKALGELAKEIANLQNNTEAQAMADRLNAQADAIAAAVEANPDPNPDD